MTSSQYHCTLYRIYEKPRNNHHNTITEMQNQLWLNDSYILRFQSDNESSSMLFPSSSSSEPSWTQANRKHTIISNHTNSQASINNHSTITATSKNKTNQTTCKSW